MWNPPAVPDQFLRLPEERYCTHTISTQLFYNFYNRFGGFVAHSLHTGMHTQLGQVHTQFEHFMAQRLFLKRVVVPSVKSLIAPAPSLSTCLSNGIRSHGLKTLTSSRLHPHCNLRPISTSTPCRVTFNVQDADDFQERVVGSETPVVVDFHAQWCGPCKILAPRLEKVVAKQQGKVVMAKVDIDDHTDLALEFEVSAVPTVLAIKNGDVVDKFVGLKDEDQLDAFLKKLIGP
uniref:Thioredoxin, mitochondrial n=1 Tax=Xenopus tropicalis TaxID=8364 RepID=A0A803K363_XENTR